MSEIEEMRSFVQLVDSGTATRAAEVRGVAISAISRRMKDLEERLGVQLLKRTTRTMTLTEEGRMFYDRSVRLLADLAEAEAEVTQRSSTLSGTLKIAAPVSFGVAHLAPVIAAFMHAHPQLSVKMDMSDRRVDLVEEGFDLAIRIGELNDSSLIARKIAVCRHVVCAAPAFFDKYGKPEHPNDLKDLPGLCYGNLSHPSQWPYADKNGNKGVVEVATKLEATNGDALREAAIAGHGVLCEPSFIVHRAIDSGALIPVLLDYKWHDMGVYAVYPPTRHLTTRIRMLIDFLILRYGENPYWEDCLDGTLRRIAAADQGKATSLSESRQDA
ncbi:MAG: LysR family transcriptional regulator [Pseudomonadota bacterium]